MYVCLYVCMYKPHKKTAKVFLEMHKLTKQVSNIINSSLNMGINKTRKFIKLQNREIPSLFFLPSLSQNPLKKKFYHWCTAGPDQCSLLGARQELGTILCSLPPEWRYLHTCKTIRPKEWQLPSACPCFLVGSMTAPCFLGNHTDQDQENKWCPRFGEGLQVVPK